MKRTKTLLILLMLTAGLVVTGCARFSGTYETANGIASVSFRAGKAYMTMMGDTEICDYEVKGDKIIVHTKADPSIIFTKNEDGTIDGPLGNMKRRRS